MRPSGKGLTLWLPPLTKNAKGGLYRRLKLFDKAVETYEMALRIFRESKDSMGMADVYNNLGNVYGEIEAFEEALLYLEMTDF